MSRLGSLTQLPLDHLAQRCAEETERFFQRELHQDEFCFELFRRAFAEKSEVAWGLVYGQYQSLVAGWVRDHSLFRYCGEEVGYFINEAFFRMARACTPAKFERFAKLSQLLAYLKACVHGATTDYYQYRVEPFPEGLLIDEIAGEPAQVSVQRTVLDDEARDELWESLRRRINNEQEAIVLENYFLLGLKPREILDLYPHVFGEQREVYQVKGNLLRRLRRDDELRRLLSHAE